ncbi:MAG: hypothetical protein KGI80_05975 [Verrucomicrobiota bacterium]|nr:hypothetical protein [Verrucomicrobiota bacterium]
MNKNSSHETPFRSKLEMLKDIALAIEALHSGSRVEGDAALKDLKGRALFFDSSIQNDVLIFAEQIVFQYDYDPLHLVTHEVEKAADRLIEDLGFRAPQ